MRIVQAAVEGKGQETRILFFPRAVAGMVLRCDEGWEGEELPLLSIAATSPVSCAAATDFRARLVAAAAAVLP